MDFYICACTHDYVIHVIYPAIRTPARQVAVYVSIELYRACQQYEEEKKKRKFICCGR